MLEIILYSTTIIIFLLMIWHLATMKYINPYTMDLYLGNKGCGKSSTEAKLIKKSIRSGETVYVNADDIKIKKARIYETYDLGKFKVTNAHIFVDELSLYFDNRQAMNRNSHNNSTQFIAWLREVRHLQLKVDMFSQSYDCDKKIRTMCDNIYIGTRYFRVLTIWRRLRKNIAIKEQGLTAESQIVDEINFTPWFMPGSIKITFIPRYVKYFDSFKDLQKYDNELSYKEVKEGYEVRRKKKKR